MIVVEDRHFNYLKLQKGSLNDLKDNRALWHAAYEKSLARDFETLRPWLPEACGAVLDIGSGLGGIDVLLYRHYDWLEICLLDGECDPPVMNLHRETFNDMLVAADFLAKNGVDPDSALSCLRPGATRAGNRFDLVISLGSWCFHYPPATYLELVRECLKPGGVLIVDVRARRNDWHAELAREFEFKATAYMASKFNRNVYHAR